MCRLLNPCENPVKKPRKRKHRAGKKSPTLEDVAREAGVSSMTVSRVINGVESVREETRRRVHAAIEAIGYSPNIAARNLATDSQIHIAMLYEKPSAYIAEFLFGGVNQVRKHQAQFIVEKCDDFGLADRFQYDVERIVSAGADGLLVAPPLADSAHVLGYLDSAGIPAVVITSSDVRGSISSVRVDGHQAAKRMTEHILALGHRRIGFIAGHPAHAASKSRIDGFNEALVAAGLPIDEELVAEGRFSYRSGLEAAEKLLALENPPTAIFASNDDMAAATIAVAHRRGLFVPSDLTVCGFDDTPLATELWPQLTTIHVPAAQLTREAVDLLVESINAHRAGRQFEQEDRLLDFQLIRRQSDAPPRVRPGVSSVS
jgi:LacI family transcriptional regulator